jgi:chromate transporter
LASSTRHYPAVRTPRSSLAELALLFLKLGTTAFGGPAAHIAMMEEEVVRRRKWFTREEFLDYLGATNLIPGPNSTEMAIHVGHVRAGWPGLIVAGVCFILPAFFIVAGIAWTYVRFGALPEVMGVMYGVKPVVIAVVAQALWGLGRTALKTRTLWVLGVVAVTLTLLGVNELLVLFGAGVVMALLRFASRRGAGGGGDASRDVGTARAELSNRSEDLIPSSRSRMTRRRGTERAGTAAARFCRFPRCSPCSAPPRPGSPRPP